MDQINTNKDLVYKLLDQGLKQFVPGYVFTLNTRPGEGIFRITDLKTLRHKNYHTIEEAIAYWRLICKQSNH